jgi:hypothetical protein
MPDWLDRVGRTRKVDPFDPLRALRVREYLVCPIDFGLAWLLALDGHAQRTRAVA